jgi:hypothetical protein
MIGLSGERSAEGCQNEGRKTNALTLSLKQPSIPQFHGSTIPQFHDSPIPRFHNSTVPEEGVGVLIRLKDDRIKRRTERDLGISVLMKDADRSEFASEDEIMSKLSK